MRSATWAVYLIFIRNILLEAEINLEAARSSIVLQVDLDMEPSLMKFSRYEGMITNKKDSGLIH